MKEEIQPINLELNDSVKHHIEDVEYFTKLIMLSFKIPKELMCDNNSRKYSLYK